MTGYYAVYRGNNAESHIQPNFKYPIIEFDTTGTGFNFIVNEEIRFACIKGSSHLRNGDWHIGKYPEAKK